MRCCAAHKMVLAVKDCNGIMSTTSSLRSSSSKWCSTLVWSLIIFAYEHYCQHKVRRIMVANYRVKLKTIRWKDVTYKQDAPYLMETFDLTNTFIDWILERIKSTHIAYIFMVEYYYELKNFWLWYKYDKMKRFHFFHSKEGFKEYSFGYKFHCQIRDLLLFNLFIQIHTHSISMRMWAREQACERIDILWGTQTLKDGVALTKSKNHILTFLKMNT